MQRGRERRKIFAKFLMRHYEQSVDNMGMTRIFIWKCTDVTLMGQKYPKIINNNGHHTWLLNANRRNNTINYMERILIRSNTSQHRLVNQRLYLTPHPQQLEVMSRVATQIQQPQQSQPPMPHYNQTSQYQIIAVDNQMGIMVVNNNKTNSSNIMDNSSHKINRRDGTELWPQFWQFKNCANFEQKIAFLCG